MTPLEWLRNRRVAAIRAAARAEPAIPAAQAYTIEPSAPGYTETAPATIAESYTAAVQHLREVAAGATVAEQAVTRSPDAVRTSGYTNPYRCGCYPRYSRCYCHGGRRVV